MIRHITDDLYQIGEYVPGENGYEAVNVYVMLNNGRSVLIDCGSHLHRAGIMADMEQVLDGAVPDYIFLTHSELPHAGNIQMVSEKWPNIKVITSNVLLPYIEILPVLPLEQITAVTPGTTIEVGERRLVFVDALLKDQPGSQWIYDTQTKTLFTGDGFGYYQTEALCNRFSDEIEGGIRVDQFVPYHLRAFRFLRWVKPDRFNADVDKMFSNRDVAIIAPIHGSAIRAEIPEHVARLKTAITQVCNSYR